MLLSPKKGINQGLVGGFWYWIFHQLHLRAPGSKGKEKTTNKHKKNSRERDCQENRWCVTKITIKKAIL